MSSYAREQRRAYEKWLKKTDPKKYQEWKSGSIDRGRQIHADNVEKVRQAESERYEARQTLMIESLRKDGLTDSEIDEHVENWVSGIKPWASDVKPTGQRSIRKSEPVEDLDAE